METADRGLPPTFMHSKYSFAYSLSCIIMCMHIFMHVHINWFDQENCSLLNEEAHTSCNAWWGIVLENSNPKTLLSCLSLDRAFICCLNITKMHINVVSDFNVG